MDSVTASITAENTGTDWLTVPGGINFDTFFGVTGSATITLQRRKASDPATIYDVKTYSVGDFPEVGEAPSDWEYRLFVKTGEYTSGTFTLTLWKQ